MKKTSAWRNRFFRACGPRGRGRHTGARLTKAPAYTAPQLVYNWTGFYIGGHVGGAFAGNNSLQGGDARFMGGVQGGFDYQFAPNWVIGAEAQYSWLAATITPACCFPAAPWSRAATISSARSPAGSATPGVRRCSTPRAVTPGATTTTSA